MSIDIYNVSQKKNVPQYVLSFYILNNSAKNEPITIIFGVQNLEEIPHQKIIKSPILSE